MSVFIQDLISAHEQDVVSKINLRMKTKFDMLSVSNGLKFERDESKQDCEYKQVASEGAPLFLLGGE